MDSDRFALCPVWGEPRFRRVALRMVLGGGIFPIGLLIIMGGVSGAPLWAYPLLAVLGLAGAGALAWAQWRREPGYLLRAEGALCMHNVLGVELRRMADAEPRTLTLYLVRRDPHSLSARIAGRARAANDPPWARLLIKSAPETALDLDGFGSQMLDVLRWLGYNTLVRSLEEAAAQHPDATLLEVKVVPHLSCEAEPAAFTITRPALRRAAGEMG